MKFAVCLALTLVLVGCANKPEIRFVKIPVYKKAERPENLKDNWQPDQLPVWLSNDDPKSSSCLSPEGEDRLKAIILELMTRNRAWEAWADEPVN
jgi:hypothetical protein